MIETIILHPAEILNLISATFLIITIGILLFDIVRYWEAEWAGVLGSLAGMIVLGMRITYYTGVIFWGYTRSSHGSSLVAIPSPFLWVAVGLLLIGFYIERKQKRKLESKLNLIREGRGW